MGKNSSVDFGCPQTAACELSSATPDISALLTNTHTLASIFSYDQGRKVSLSTVALPTILAIISNSENDLLIKYPTLEVE